MMVPRYLQHVQVCDERIFRSYKISASFICNSYQSKTMFKVLPLPSMILLATYFTNMAQCKDDDIQLSTIENPPLILFKGIYGQLKLPTDIKIKKSVLLKKKKIVFTSNPSLYDQLSYCPAETKQQKAILEKAKNIDNQHSILIGEKVDQYCLFRKSKSKITSCKNTPQPKLMKQITKKPVTENKPVGNLNPIFEETRCGPSDVGTNFLFGYQICEEYRGWDKVELFLYTVGHKNEVSYPLEDVQHVHMYELCYDAKKNEILYTFHTIIAPRLLSSPLLKAERQKMLEMETYNSINMPAIDFKEVKSRLKQVEDSEVIPKYKIQLLVPPDDFPLAIWRRPIHHYSNANLMHEELQSCWDDIHKKIREDSTKPPKYYDIYTGAFKLPSENGDIKTITGIKIPKIWVKVIHYERSEEEIADAVAIVANNYRDDTVNQLIQDKYRCKKNLCKGFILEKNAQIADDIRCCAVTEEIQALFGIQLAIEKILSIPDLIVVPEERKFQQSISSPPR